MYFKKFGVGWLVAGFILAVIVSGFGVLFSRDIGQIMSAILIGFFFTFCLFLAGFMGFLRFFAWVVSWEILVLLNGLIDKFILRAGAGGGEYLGPVALLLLPLFVLLGIADEIRYKIKNRGGKLKANMNSAANRKA